MTWAARTEELGPPLGLVRKNSPNEREGGHSTLEPHGAQVQIQARDEDDGTINESCDDFTAPFSSEPQRDGAHDDAQSDAQNDNDTRSKYADLSRYTAKFRTKAFTLVAAVGLAGSAALMVPACAAIESVPVAITACLSLIRALMDLPTNELPPGYMPCDTIVWPVNDLVFKFCLYCNPTKPTEIYVQFDCEGKFYPMKLRRIDNQPVPVPNGSIDSLNNEYLAIKKMNCDELFLIEAETTVAPFMDSLACKVRSPNDRVLPSIADYGTLDVRVANVPVPRDGDFEVESGAKIELSGSFDEVTHYAMICGISELSFKDGATEWTVFANPEVSAIAVFRNDELYDARFIFAPQPTGGGGG
ncbi:MAG: hypothetical protein RL591_931 [Planctomycetota bacterium]|jgi:hypothetical protein